jgi:hypothetical protein
MAAVAVGVGEGGGRWVVVMVVGGSDGGDVGDKWRCVRWGVVASS